MADDFSRRGFLEAAGAAAVVGVVARAGAAQAGESPQAGKIKILAVSCSSHAGKNTSTALKTCLDAAKAVAPNQIETELIELAGLKINGLVAAGVELEPGERDDFPSLVPKLTDPRVAGIVVGTPVYFSNMSSLCKAFLERCGEFRKKDYLWTNKLAGVVAVGGTRNGGQELAAQSVAAALFCQDMVVVGPGKPNSRFGALLWAGKEGVATDETGLAAAASLGRRMAEIARKMG